MSINKAPELLSPAGTMESVYAAVNNGCNAIYLGGKQFSARQSAANFSEKEIEEVCDYCHLRNVKVYVTVNTVYKDKEIAEYLKFVKLLYAMGVDALILQDLGAAKLVKEHFPDFALHASTQLTSNNIDDVNFLIENGFQKIVLSRELNLKEITEITANTDVEIETFIHGALCVSYSGQCIMSSMLGGRSGNRGRCAQTCRLPYSLYKEFENLKEGHLLCPKDIQTVTILPQLIEAGISSFKIEGRMKNPEYVAGVTAIYRKYIDIYMSNPEGYHVDEKDIKVLLQLFNRGGFTEGYYNTHSGSNMMSIERPKTWGLKTGFVDSYNAKLGRATIRTREPLVPGDGIEVWTQKEPHTGTNISRVSKAGEVISLLISGDISKNDVVYKTHDKALSDALKKTWEKDTRKKMIYGSLKLKIGEPVSLKLWDMEGNSVFEEGEVVQTAQNQPILLEKVKQQIMKTGATPFKLDELEITADEQIYIGISSLNELRRSAVEKLTSIIIKKSKRNTENNYSVAEIIKAPIRKDKKMNVLVNTKYQFDIAVTYEPVNIIYFECNDDFEENLEECINICKKEDVKLYAALPRIYRQYSKEIYSSFIEKLKQSDIDGFLVRSGGQYLEVKSTEKEINIDFSLNIFNNEAVSFWNEKEADIITLSPELNLQEICEMGAGNCEMLVYGYLPLMTTHQCPVGNFAGEKTHGIFCKEKGTQSKYHLKDRKGMKFPIMMDCKQCVATILNGQPLFTLKFFNEIMVSPTGHVRLMFTKENAKEVKNILYAYGDMLKDDKNPSIDAKIMIEYMDENGSTKGHYFRGVE